MRRERGRKGGREGGREGEMKEGRKEGKEQGREGGRRKVQHRFRSLIVEIHLSPFGLFFLSEVLKVDMLNWQLMTTLS